MIEFLKIIGSALITAAVTIYAMHVKRRWEKQDKDDDAKSELKDTIDKMSDQLTDLTKKVDKLSSELDKEVEDTDLKTSALQSGLREILYDRIKFLCRKYVAEGKLREEDYKSLRRMWNVYHEELEGNGFLDGEMKEVDKLEIY